nr:hypothetical protein [Halochromatium salexigens]
MVGLPFVVLSFEVVLPDGHESFLVVFEIFNGDGIRIVENRLDFGKVYPMFLAINARPFHHGRSSWMIRLRSSSLSAG